MFLWADHEGAGVMQLGQHHCHQSTNTYTDAIFFLCHDFDFSVFFIYPIVLTFQYFLNVNFVW